MRREPMIAVDIELRAIGGDGARALHNVAVDASTCYSWIPASVLSALGITGVRADRFAFRDGTVVEREVGFALVRVGERDAPTVVVFARANDPTTLGAHALSGLGLMPGAQGLADSGPHVAA